MDAAVIRSFGLQQVFADKRIDSPEDEHNLRLFPKASGEFTSPTSTPPPPPPNNQPDICSVLLLEAHCQFN